jgi:hypothetical protein
MFTEHIVIQKIDIDGSAQFYESHSREGLRWEFETRRSSVQGDLEIFPFNLDNGIHKKRAPGPETRIYSRPGEIQFSDDYSLIQNFMVGILFPMGFVPTALKFRDRPQIPMGRYGQLVSMAPGNFTVLYNYQAKLSALVFIIHQPITFSFTCVAHAIKAFPRQVTQVTGNNEFDLIIETNRLGIEKFTDADLKFINLATDTNVGDGILDLIQQIVCTMNNNNGSLFQNLMLRLQIQVRDTIGFGADLLQIIDSLKTGNEAHQVIANILPLAG